MKKHKFYFVLVSLALLILLLPSQLVFAQDGSESTECTGDSVTGIVVAANEETGQITIATEDGLCSVTLQTDYGHPIANLLGAYFGDISLEDLQDAVAAMSVCVLYNEASDSWAQADCGTEGAVPVNLAGDNSNGTFTAVTEDGELITLSVDDAELAASLSEGLAALLQDWELTEDGNVTDVGQDIADYHNDGMGFGVLVKLYAISQETGVPVEDLVAAFQSGMGIGELFALYGKPSKVGVGHVIQEIGPPGNGNGSDNGNGNGNSNNGNGNNNDNIPGYCKNEDKGNGNGNDKGNNGNGNGNDKDCPEN